MDVPPRLLKQDRVDFERALARALDAARIREAVARGSGGPDVEKLRALARESAPGILLAATEEYGDYAKLRAAADLAGTLGGRPDRSGLRRGDGGLLGALAVLGPILAGIAAVIFYLLGHTLELLDSQHQLADSLVEAAWTAAIVAAAGAFAGVGGLLIQAARQRSAGPSENTPVAPVPDTLLLARDAWRSALIERGMTPFLLGHLEPGASATPPSGHDSALRGARFGSSTPADTTR